MKLKMKRPKIWFVVLKESLLAFADKILLLLDVHITYMQMEETSLAYISMIYKFRSKDLH